MEAGIFDALPQGVTLDDLRTAMEPEILGVPDHRTGQGCLVTGHINGPFFNLRMPMVFYIIHSNFGGWISARCRDGNWSCDCPNYLSLEILFWVGVFVPPLTQFYTAV